MRPPATDRQEGDRHAPGDPVHPGEQGRIPGKVDAERALDEVADAARARLERPAPVAGVNDGQSDRIGVRPGRVSRRKLKDLARNDLPDGSTSTPGRTPEPAGDDHERIAADSSKRVEVEVVWMGVRHEDGVDLTDRPRIRRRADPTQGPETRPEQGIGQ